MFEYALVHSHLCQYLPRYDDNLERLGGNALRHAVNKPSVVVALPLGINQVPRDKNDNHHTGDGEGGRQYDAGHTVGALFAGERQTSRVALTTNRTVCVYSKKY